MAAARLALLTLLSSSLLAAAYREPPPAPPLPKNASDWIGAPLTWAGLRGRVVLLNVWTFG